MVAQNYIVVNGVAYSRYTAVENGYCLWSDNIMDVNNGYEIYDGEQGVKYRKFIPKEAVEEKYGITDYAIYKDRKFQVCTISDIAFDKADSFVTLFVSDEAFLRENNLLEDSEIFPGGKYGSHDYVTPKIPATEVSLVRTRRSLTI